MLDNGKIEDEEKVTTTREQRATRTVRTTTRTVTTDIMASCLSI